MLRSSAALLLLTSSLLAQEVPKPSDPSLRVELFAAEPLIQQPIGMAIDKKGRLLVIESHTHFRPKDWTGPAHDQIVALEDRDRDGKAEARSVIFDQTDMTMDIATAPDGSVYLSTRNEILRLDDKDNDGSYEQVTRKLVFLETEGTYPHNGLSGLAFDGKGGLYFGMGENLGAAYKLIGTDDTAFTDQGEGGNIWHVKLDGKGLKRIATGFWNPFGVCMDPWGNVFATDNDPDSSPPCRLHHIMPNADYGYAFRYGRSGTHPFVSWNGEIPGTLPMLAGTGEAPCDVLCYAPSATSSFRGLPTGLHGQLLVASWVDHRIEAYQLTPKDGTFTAKQSILVQGGADFRPVAFAVAPDGALYVSDWVQRSYELHGQGRVWRIAQPSTESLAEGSVKPYPTNAEADLRETILYGPTPSDAEVLSWLKLRPPYLRHATIERLSREGDQLRAFAEGMSGDVFMDTTVMLAARHALAREGAPLNELGYKLIVRGLASSEPPVQIAALRWIADERLRGFRVTLESMQRDPKLTAPVHYALLTTLARMDDPKITEAALITRLKDLITSEDSSFLQRQLALQVIPDRNKHVTAANIEPILAKASPVAKAWLLHYLGSLSDEARLPILESHALDKKAPDNVRSAALCHAQLSSAALGQIADEAQDQKLSDDLRLAMLQSLIGTLVPAAGMAGLTNIDHLALTPAMKRVRNEAFASLSRPNMNMSVWKAYLGNIGGEVSVANGRRVFMSSKLGGCVRCHRAEGIGGQVGPTLDHIGSTDETALIESILKPSANVAPQYQAVMLVTKDGKARTAYTWMERGGNHTYIELTGETFEVKIEDIVSRTPLPISIMPEGLINGLTDVEVRDLLAYLKSLGQ